MENLERSEGCNIRKQKQTKNWSSNPDQGVFEC